MINTQVSYYISGCHITHCLELKSDETDSIRIFKRSQEFRIEINNKEKQPISECESLMIALHGKEAKSKGDLQRLLCVDEIGEFQVCENPYSTVTC